MKPQERRKHNESRAAILSQRNECSYVRKQPYSTKMAHPENFGDSYVSEL